MGGNEARSSFGLAENLFTASSLTKVYGLAGLRCGWILAPEPLAGILSQRFDTAVVPGRFFEDPRHFRLGFGVPAEVLARGVANIKKALAE